MSKPKRPCRVPTDIEENLRRFLAGRKPNDRYASFDYCFTYFQSYREAENYEGIAKNLQPSCLQLGFYLASWGMMRGSTDLLRRSVRQLVPVVEAIAAAPAALWSVDTDSYSEETWPLLDSFARTTRSALPGGASDTLVTKIMLGVFGCVPAFDQYFRVGSGLSTFGTGALESLRDFYEDHKSLVDAHLVPTLDFHDGQDSTLHYTRAKVIDMIFFIEGGSPRGA